MFHTTCSCLSLTNIYQALVNMKMFLYSVIFSELGISTLMGYEPRYAWEEFVALVF